MVILHYKKSDANTFLYETFAAIQVDELVKVLTESKFSHVANQVFYSEQHETLR